MTEIPSDVMKAAYDAALDYRNDKACDPIHNDDALQLAFARAILAERGRCAKVANDSEAEFMSDAELWKIDKMPNAAERSTAQASAARIIAVRINNS